MKVQKKRCETSVCVQRGGGFNIVRKIPSNDMHTKITWWTQEPAKQVLKGESS